MKPLAFWGLTAHTIGYTLLAVAGVKNRTVTYAFGIPGIILLSVGGILDYTILH